MLVRTGRLVLTLGPEPSPGDRQDSGCWDAPCSFYQLFSLLVVRCFNFTLSRSWLNTHMKLIHCYYVFLHLHTNENTTDNLSTSETNQIKLRAFSLNHVSVPTRCF